MSGSSRGIQLFSLMEKGQHVPDVSQLGEGGGELHIKGLLL